jgi:transposase
MKQAQAARAFGVSRWSVVQWTNLHRSNAAQALAPRRRGRRAGEAGKLSIKQAQRIRALMVAKCPSS